MFDFFTFALGVLVGSLGMILWLAWAAGRGPTR